MNGTSDQRREGNRQSQTADNSGRQRQQNQPNRRRLGWPGLSTCSLPHVPATPPIDRQACL